MAGTLELPDGVKIEVTAPGVVAGGEGIEVNPPTALVSLYSSIDAVQTAFTAATPVTKAAIVNVNSSDLTTANVPGGKKLYVLGNLTFDALPADAAAGDVLAYGKFVIAATTVDLSDTKVDTLDISAATITTSDGTTARTLTLDGATTVKAVNAAAGLTFSGTNAFTVTGDAYFGGDVIFGGAATFNGLAVFSGNVSLAAGGATFGNTAFVADTKAITLTVATSAIKLKHGAGLAIGTPAGNASDVYSMVIINSNASADLTLTPAAGTVLTFSASTSGKGITQSGSGNHSIKISGTGPATLIPGSTYTVESEATKTGTLEIDTGATLELAAGALATEDPPGSAAFESKLVLIGATSDGAKLIGTSTGSLKAGATTITGTWQAVGTGDVTIASTNTSTSSIAASLATVALTTDTTGAGTITQAAGGTLTVEGSVKAGALILGAGSWTATAAAATIEADKITLSADDDATFGKDDGTEATVLTGTDAATNTFTVTGTDATVTLSQSGNALVITGNDAAATLTPGATAGIKATGGLTITTATLDISTNGSIVLPVASVLTLSNTDSVINSAGTPTVAVTNPALTNVTFAGVTVTSEAATGAKVIGTIAAKADGTPGTLTVDTAAVTLDKTTTVTGS